MMNFLPQGYSFQSDSNPYQSQFVSPYYGSGQYGWQYSPMAQTGPRLPTAQPGTAPPWLPPGLVATTSSGVQELSVLFDPTLAARMSRAYDPWAIAYWGKPDIPAWLWPDGSAPRPVPPNVCCQTPPCVGPGGYGGGGGAPPPGVPGIEPPPNGAPELTPGPVPTPTPTPKYLPPPNGRPTPTPGPQITPSPFPKSTQPNPGSPLRRGMFNSRWARARAPQQPVGFSTMPAPSAAAPSGPTSYAAPSQERRFVCCSWREDGTCRKTVSCTGKSLVDCMNEKCRPLTAPTRARSDQCYKAPDKEACYKCCAEGRSAAERQECLNGCVGLPTPKPSAPGRGGVLSRSNGPRAEARRLSRISRSARRRGAAEPGWVALPGRPRGWCGPGEHLCTKKTPSGKSNFCCCNQKGNCVGGRIVLA